MKEPFVKDAKKIFHLSIILIAFLFSLYFVFGLLPNLLDDFDVLGAFAAGFVNPYATGYSLDVIGCWLVLASWVLYERKILNVRGGWVALVLGVVPGVVVGLVTYFLIRNRQLSDTT